MDWVIKMDICFNLCLTVKNIINSHIKDLAHIRVHSSDVECAVLVLVSMMFNEGAYFN